MGAVCSKQSHVAETKLRVDDAGQGGADGRQVLQKAAVERAEEAAAARAGVDGVDEVGQGGAGGKQTDEEAVQGAAVERAEEEDPDVDEVAQGGAEGKQTDERRTEKAAVERTEEESAEDDGVNDVGPGGAEGRRCGRKLLQKLLPLPSQLRPARAGAEALPEPIHVPALGASPSIRLRDIPHVLDAILQHFKEDLKRVLPRSDDGQPIWPVERIPPPSSPV